VLVNREIPPPFWGILVNVIYRGKYAKKKEEMWKKGRKWKEKGRIIQKAI
jgi:hypothetical protein